MELIDKAAVVAEIEKRIKETESMQPKFDQFWAGQISAFKGVLKILDTLEVKAVYNDEYELESDFKTGVKWGMEQTEVKIQAQSIAVAHGCPKELVSEDLKEAANNYVGHAHEIDEDLSCFAKRNAFITGSKWQEEQCQKTIELAEDHAYLAGQEKIITKACEWLENHNDYICGGTNGTSWYDMQQLVKDFKKAMEE